MFNFHKYRCKYVSTDKDKDKDKDKSCFNNNNNNYNNIQNIKNPLKCSPCSGGNYSHMCSLLSACSISFALGYFTHYYFTRNN